MRIHHASINVLQYSILRSAQKSELRQKIPYKNADYSKKWLTCNIIHSTFKGTVQPDWICMRVVPLKKPGKWTATGFWFFNFDLEFWAASYKNASNPPICWDHGLIVTNRPPKMRESQQLVFGLRFVRRIFEKSLTSRSPNQNSASIWQIFSSNNSAPDSGKTGYKT